jgi:two-component system chemotaxis response regulator CheY
MLLTEVNVLVVDDVNSMRVNIRDLLKGAGFSKVKVAGGVDDAKKLLEDEPIHLVLSDLHMEPLNGLDFLAYVRSHPVYKTVPFLMVTAENTKEHVLGAIAAGVDDYIMKPFTAVQLQNKVYGVLQRKKVIGS